MSKEWNLVHSLGSEAKWTDGFRAEFKYRDLGIEAGTKGAFTAHLIKAKPGVEVADIHEWHVHDCTFQLVLVLEGWAASSTKGTTVSVSSARATVCSNQPVETSRAVLLRRFRVSGSDLTRRLRHPRRRSPGRRHLVSKPGTVYLLDWV